MFSEKVSRRQGSPLSVACVTPIRGRALVWLEGAVADVGRKEGRGRRVRWQVAVQQPQAHSSLEGAPGRGQVRLPESTSRGLTGSAGYSRWSMNHIVAVLVLLLVAFITARITEGPILV